MSSTFDEDSLIEESLVSDQQRPQENISEALIEELLDANEIEIGDDLDQVTQLQQKDESELRFSITAQKNDLLDELLSDIPTSKRTTLVLNNIHKIIERYSQLRNKFSTFDNLGNAYMPKIKTAIHKPLIDNLKTFDKNLFWIKPVVKNMKNVYDIPNAEITDDLLNNDLYNNLNEYNNLIEDLKRKNQDDIQKYHQFFIDFIVKSKKGIFLLDTKARQTINTAIYKVKGLNEYIDSFNKEKIKSELTFIGVKESSVEKFEKINSFVLFLRDINPFAYPLGMKIHSVLFSDK